MARRRFVGNTWEAIDDNTDRLRVPGGWIVRTTDIFHNMIAQTYVPDHLHEWELNDENSKEKDSRDDEPSRAD